MTEIYYFSVKTVMKFCLKIDEMETDGRLNRGNGTLEGISSRRTFQLHEVTPEMRSGHRVVRLHDRFSPEKGVTSGNGFTGEVYLLPNKVVNTNDGNKGRFGRK